MILSSSLSWSLSKNDVHTTVNGMCTFINDMAPEAGFKVCWNSNNGNIFVCLVIHTSQFLLSLIFCGLILMFYFEIFLWMNDMNGFRDQRRIWPSYSINVWNIVVYATYASRNSKIQAADVISRKMIYL